MKKNNYLIFAGIGLELIGIELAMAWIGHSIDQEMGWPGFAIAGLLILGLVGWLVHVVRLLQHVVDDEEEVSKEK